MHLLIVEARFYDDIADAMVAGAEAEIAKNGDTFDRISVPGALEIPGAIAMAAKSGRYDGFVALGCIIRGETYHFEVVSNESARGLMDLSIRKRLAIGNGILTCENRDQAWVRADAIQKDKGGDAAAAACRMARLKQDMAVDDR